MRLSSHVKAFRDLCALLLLGAYGLLAYSASSASGGPVLDPVLAEAQRRGSLRVAVDVGFRPFADELNGELTGYDVELARAVAERIGLRAEFVPTGFDALYDSLTSGRADLIASALPYAPEQGFRARFSAVYFDVGQLLVVPADAPTDDLGDLAGGEVGVALGSDADAIARRIAPANGFILRSDYDEPAEAFADLEAGRLDAVIADGVAARVAIQQAACTTQPGPCGGALRIAEALSYEPLVLGMPRAAFQLEAEVNRALEELRAEGLLAALEARWMR
jgi:polar amino acid transport system substrate-binding protein